LSTLNHKISWNEKIFSPNLNFIALANEIYELQLNGIEVFRNWKNQISALQQPKKYKEFIELHEFNYLPISFFKTHTLLNKEVNKPHLIFESSGTTKSVNSKHYVAESSIYKQSFLEAFENIYGNISNFCILGLLPSYLERNNSSLVFMVNDFIEKSNHPKSNFYLNNFNELHQTLIELEKDNQPTLLIGVTYALLDFAEYYPINLKSTIVMETGGMKGRKKEMLRQEVHHYLQQQFSCNAIHSEYGMTELLSQAYATNNGRFICPPWMKVLVRPEDDPLNVNSTGKGILNIIDLANVHSCSFIATDDVGIVYEDGSFEVLGRLDNSDLRGCSLMYNQ
jgi:hypothetical protein